MLRSPVDWHKRYQEQARWTKDLRQFLYRRTGVEKAERILDLGCGTGVLAKELGETTQAEIHCLDINPAYIRYAAEEDPGQFPTIGDAHQLPYDSEIFDITLCHFLLLWVSNPAQVLSEMIRVTRAGGVVMSLAEPDYGGRIDYPLKLEKLGTLQQESLRLQGADPLMGRRLAGLFSSAGLAELESGVLGGQWSRQTMIAGFESEWRIFKSDLAYLANSTVEENLPLTEAELRKLKELSRAASARGERVLFVPTFYAWGIKPDK